MKSKIFAGLIAVQLIGLCVFSIFVHQKSVYWKTSLSGFPLQAYDTRQGKELADKINTAFTDFAEKAWAKYDGDTTAFSYKECVNSRNLCIIEISTTDMNPLDENDLILREYELWVVFDSPQPSILIQEKRIVC